MKSQPWDRGKRIASVREDVWRHVTQAARREQDLALEAAALLRMRPDEIRTLATIQFIASEQVERLFAQMPFLIRRLKTTTEAEEEVSAERVRGSIRWGATFTQRAASGVPHIYVTAPARRAFNTPENQILVFALNAIRTVGRRTGWHRSFTPELGALVRDRVAQAERWLQARMLVEVPPSLPTPQLIARVRSGRAARRYAAALDVVRLHDQFLRRADRTAIQQAVQQHALVTTANDVLLELISGFAIERALVALGWTIHRPGLISGGVFLQAHLDGRKIELYYQHTPKALSYGSVYRDVQQRHGFARAGPLIPDFVARLESPGIPPRWVIFEVKGVERPVADSARQALQNLLAYRRAFEPALADQRQRYGLGIAWGSELDPSSSAEILLATPDTVEQALRQLLGHETLIAR